MENQSLNYIDNIDFSMIRRKMSDEEDGLGWDAEQLTIAEMEYKNFLKLILLFPERTFVPSKLMDEFWHYHILDTRKYYEDCNNIYGQIIHHYPYFGMNGKEDKKALEKCFSETKEIYKSTFSMELNMNYSSRCESSSCGGKCRN